jgi:hypothetical protein
MDGRARSAQGAVSQSKRVRFFGAIIFGMLGIASTVMAFMFPFAWILYLPLVIVVWLVAFLFVIHGFRPRS